jgi:hypothetical protein
MDWFVFIFWGIIGFVITRLYSGKKVGKEGIAKSLFFNLGEYRIHIHHWMVGLLFILVLALFGVYNDLAYGFLVGMTIQGLMYKDYYKVVSKK